MSQIPGDYRYTKKHEWAKVEAGLLSVGITDFAQNALGDVVYVDIKGADTILEQGAEFGAIESVKAAEDLYSPVAGTVAEVNSSLNDSPEKVNQDPYGAWMVKLKDFNQGQFEGLLSADDYKKYVESLDQ